MKKIIHTGKGPETIGPYNQAIVETSTGFVFTSGQIGMDPLTGDMVGDDITSQTRQVFANLKEVLAAAGCTFDNVIKSTIYLKNMSDFSAVNTIYAEHFIRDFPARATVEASGLPRNALVEIDMIAHIG